MADERTVTLNDDQKVYVIPSSGGGYSCYGYDNAFQAATGLSDAIAEKRPDLAAQALEQKPDPQDWGTMAVYNAYRTLVGIVSREKIDLGTWYNPGTHPEVKRQLELARNGRYRIRIEYGDAETGRAFDERGIAGTVSRSMGPLKTPLLIARRGSHGGQGILSADIVKISATPGGVTLWQHENYTPAAKRDITPAA